MAIVSFAEALEIVRSHAQGLRIGVREELPLLDTAGRILAQDVRADRDQPPFDRSTRDGFGVRAAEWDSGRQLRVVGQIRAGERWPAGELPPASAVEIMTGAPVPAGVDAVAMVEHAELLQDTVMAASGRSLRPGDNIVAQASEAKAGHVVIPAGTPIGAAEVAAAATCGRTTLPVYGRPAVAIVATGDELVGLDDTPEPHQIRNSNTYGIAALVAASGGTAVPLQVARDRREDVRDRITEGFASDLLVLSGGVSAGKYDLVEEVLAEFGAEFLFTGVRMQPGKPIVFGRIPNANDGDESGWQYFFGLPGNPVSTQVTFHCFVEPFLRVFGGAPWTGPRFARATIAEAAPAKPGLTRVLPASMSTSVESAEVRLVPWQGSGDLAANTRANCYAVLPDGVNVEPGDSITVLLR